VLDCGFKEHMTNEELKNYTQCVEAGREKCKTGGGGGVGGFINNITSRIKNGYRQVKYMSQDARDAVVDGVADITHRFRAFNKPEVKEHPSLLTVGPDAQWLIKRFEKRRLKVYDDAYPDKEITDIDAYKPTGKLTVGYGHQLKTEEIRSGKFKNGISKDEAETLLKADIAVAESDVKSLIWNKDVRLTQHQYEALVVFLFNTGKKNWVIESEMFKKLNKLDYEGTLEEWAEVKLTTIKDPVTGEEKQVVLHGLERRRKAEHALWNRR
jgi:GH24 family phage-related lysozyme (muramidase)